MLPICIALAIPVVLLAADPPPDLLKRALLRETEAAAERGQYAFRQIVHIEEYDLQGRKKGDYREARDVVFTPEGKRHEKFFRKPVENLHRLRLTEEDFRDIREVQPFLFTSDQLSLYQTKPRGEEAVEGIACWVLDVRPRQILDGQRLFEGLAWIDQRDYSVIRMEGRAVPQTLSRKNENLFPRFTTTRRQVDGKNWFPETTYADDVLPFSTGPLRMRMRIEYSNYQRFTSETKITFGETR